MVRDLEPRAVIVGRQVYVDIWFNQPSGTGRLRFKRQKTPEAGQILTEALQAGHALTATEIKAIYSAYGYTTLDQLAPLCTPQRYTARTGVNIQRVRYRGTYIYYKGDSSLEETDLPEVLDRIDRNKQTSHQIRKI